MSFKKMSFQLARIRFSKLLASDIIAVQPIPEIKGLFYMKRKHPRPSVYKERTSEGCVIIYNEWVKGYNNEKILR